MYRRVYRKTICLSQKLGRNTQIERRRIMNLVANEEEHSESENRQRHTPGEEYRHPEQGGVQQEVMNLKGKSLTEPVLPGLYLPLVNYFVSLFTSDRFMDLPQDAFVTFLR